MRVLPVAAVSLVGLACAAPAVVARDNGPVASAAATRVSLAMTGGYAVRVIRACREKSTHHYTLYRRGRRIAFRGRISPAPPAGFRVALKLKKCAAGHDFRTVRELTVRGGSNGRFSGAIAARGRGDYWLRAEYARVKSSKEQFRVP